MIQLNKKEKQSKKNKMREIIKTEDNNKNKQEQTKKKEIIEKNKIIEEQDDPQLNILFRSLSNNYIFFITVFFCLYKLKQNPKYDSSYIKLVFSFILTSFLGYFVHYISHHINFTEYHKKNDNILTRNRYINYVIKVIFNLFDFHNITHHDKGVNKTIMNITYEFLNNVVMQGLGFILLIKMIDTRVFILWAFMYASIHNINYLFINPSTHQDHHINNHTNYGIDYCDILFNTKTDWNDVEIHNHGSINLLIITYVMMYFT